MAPIPADGIGPIDPAMRAERLAERRRKDRDALLARYVAMRFRPDVETDAWFEDRVRHILSVSDGHFEQSAESMTALAAGDRLGEIRLPTLMIAGAVDGLLPANLADFQRLPNATLEVLSRAGHEVAVHEPDRVAEAIANFMAHGPVTAASLTASLTASLRARLASG
jgi:pimeloyl-ACP methyl ester carboxylesterase